MATGMVHLPLRVSPKLKERITKMAEKEGVPNAEYIRFLLQTGLDFRNRKFAVRRTNGEG